MRKHGFFNQNYIGFNKENIFFADTRKEKIDIISKIKCDWFIDDLREVLIDQNFPLNTKKIFFNKNKQENKIKNIIAYNNWSDILNAANAAWGIGAAATPQLQHEKHIFKSTD